MTSGLQKPAFTTSLCKEPRIYYIKFLDHKKTPSKYVFMNHVFVQVWALIWTNQTEAESKL